MPRGFFTLLKREAFRFLSLPNQTLLPPVVSVVLYVIVFGFFLGNHVREIEGVPYLTYIFPGLIIMGSTMASFQNPASSLFISRWEHFIDDLLVAPIPYFHMVCAYILAAILRGMLVAGLSLGVLFFFVRSPVMHPFYFLLSVFCSSACFACLGVISGLYSKRWDHIAIIQNYVVTPMVFLGGVFYSAMTLPEQWRWISYINPLHYMVAAIRYSCIGVADIGFASGILVTSGIGLILFIISVELFRRGYNLRS